MKIRILLVAAVLVAAGLAALSSITGQSVPGLVVQGMLAPFRFAGNALMNQAQNFYSYMFEYEALAAENEALRQQIADMNDLAREADAVARENERLRDVLDMTGTHEDYELVDAYIISCCSTDWSNTLPITRCTQPGLDVCMLAITSDR